MRGKFHMPKNTADMIFYGLYRRVEGEGKVLNTYVIKYTRNGNRLRGIEPLGQFVKYGKPKGSKQEGVENPAGFGKPEESKFVYEPMPWFCPHTTEVAMDIEKSLNPRLFVPLKEETMRFITSKARRAHICRGGTKTEKVSAMKGTEHFFEVRLAGNPNLMGIIDKDGGEVCKLDVGGLLDSSSETFARANALKIETRLDGKLLRFYKQFSLAIIKRCEGNRSAFMFGDAMPKNLPRTEDIASHIQQLFTNLHTYQEVEISQAEAAFRLHTLEFVLRERGLAALPAGEEELKEIMFGNEGYAWHLHSREWVPIKARDKDGERQPLVWDARMDDLRWHPTFAEFKEAVKGLNEAGISITGISIGAAAQAPNSGQKQLPQQ